MELSEVMRTTFACREYTDEAVSDRQIHDILELARFAPSGGNRQGNRVVVVRDPATKKRLSELAEPAAKRYGAQVAAGENPWNTVIPTARVRRDRRRDRAAGTAGADLPHRPGAAGVPGRPSGRCLHGPEPRARRCHLRSASIYPFVWNTLLAAREAGLGGTITTLTSAEEPRVQELLGVPQHYAVAAVVPLGRPVRQLTRLRRRPVAEIATIERFDGEPLA